MADLYHIFSIHPRYPLNRVVVGVKERDEAISDWKKVRPTIDIYYQKVKPG